MSFDRLWTRIFGSFAVVLVLILGSAAWRGEVEIRRFQTESVEARLETAADLLLDTARLEFLRAEPSAEFAVRVAELARATGLRLTFVRADGGVIADSSSTPPLANHGDRQEVRTALETGRGVDQRKSSTTGVVTHYLALRVDRDGRALGCVRAAAELSDMERALDVLHRGLAAAALLALGLGLLVSAWLARRIARPLERIAEQATALAAGELDRPIYAGGPAETRALARTLNDMGRELAGRVQSERGAREELETVLASMAEGVVALDADERVVLMNDAAARLLGLERAIEPGIPLWQSVRYPELERELRATLADGRERQFDASSPGVTGWLLAASVAPLSPSSVTRPRGAVVLLSDVTAVRRLDQMRADFVANVSHELRTPLAAVLGALETLDDPDQDEKTRETFLDLAMRNAARLKAIVNDLLDLSSIEAGGGSLVLEELAIGEPLRSAAAALQGAARKKGVELAVHVNGTAQLSVRGHRERLEQCFTNLIANAIQYTPTGGRVGATLRSTSDAIEIEVADTGIGIPAASLPRVFERFYRVDRGRGRDSGGTGLGLALVKHIVLAHDGTVDVDSEEGAGSKFTVRLPRVRP